jgi:hypothetical protein
MSLINQYEDLVSALTHSAGHTAINLGHEFIFDLPYYNLKDFHDKYLDQAYWLSTHERDKSCPMPKITALQRREIYKIERYEREMILNNLKFSTHIMINKYSEPIDSRRFMTTNDSCLSFAQVTVDPLNYRWVFVSRSTEVNKMLPADLYTIGYIIDNWITWFIDYSPTHYNPQRGIRVLIVLNNPHYYK